MSFQPPFLLGEKILHEEERTFIDDVGDEENALLNGRDHLSIHPEQVRGYGWLCRRVLCPLSVLPFNDNSERERYVECVSSLTYTKMGFRPPFKGPSQNVSTRSYHFPTFLLTSLYFLRPAWLGSLTNSFFGMHRRENNISPSSCPA